MPKLDHDRISQLFSKSHDNTCGSQLCIADGSGLTTWPSGATAQDLVNTYSVSKLVVVLAVHAAWESGALDIDKPVSHYWPAFAQQGKAGITVQHVLEHASGVPHFGEPMTTVDTYDWERTCGILARTRPLHPPGQFAVYHARTFGFLLGEVIRRTVGCTLPAFVESTIDTAPSKFYFGVPNDQLTRVRPLVVPPDLDGHPKAYRASQAKAIAPDAAPYVVTVFQNPVNAILAPNDTRWLQACLPSSGGVSNAPMIVDIMRSFFARHPRSRQRAAALTKEGVASTIDLALGIPVNWLGGFEANNGEFGVGATRLGYRAIGGSIAFFDLNRDLFFSYTTARMIPQPGLHPAHDPRIEHILDALSDMT